MYMKHNLNGTKWKFVAKRIVNLDLLSHLLNAILGTKVIP